MSTRAVALVAAAVAVLLAVGVVVGANLGREQDPALTTTSQTPSPKQAATTESYNPDAGDAGDEQHEDGPPEVQEADWAPAVDNFARNFTLTDGGAQKWRQRLIGDPEKPYVTDAVAKQLATVDVRNVPDGHYDGREIVKSSSYDFAVKVTYREGWAMILYLVTDGRRYQVYAYDKWEE